MRRWMEMNVIMTKTPFEIFKEMQELETREEMIKYLKALPRKDEDIWNKVSYSFYIIVRF